MKRYPSYLRPRQLARKLFAIDVSSGDDSGFSMEILMHHQSMTWLGDLSMLVGL